MSSTQTFWSAEEQNRWEIARKEARQLEALLSQKVVALEKRTVIKEDEVDLSPVQPVSGSPDNAAAAAATFTVVLNPNSSETLGGRHAGDTQLLGVRSGLSNSNALRMDHSAAHSAAQTKKSLRQIEEEFQASAEEVHGFLNAFQTTLSRLFDLTRVLPATHPHHLVAQRLQSVLEDRRHQLQRAKDDFQRHLHRLQLVPSIRRDMEVFKENAEVRLLMDEQRSLRATQSRVHRILDQADSTQDMLRQQRERFDHVANGLLNIVERVPVIKRTLSRIDSRRRREVVCLGCVIGFCLFLVVICW